MGDTPYYWWQLLDGEVLLMDASNDGVIAQDGNVAHQTYLAWAEDNTTPTTVEVSPVDVDAAAKTSAVTKLVKLGLTTAEARAIAGL